MDLPAKLAIWGTMRLRSCDSITGELASDYLSDYHLLGATEALTPLLAAARSDYLLGP
jgi:hypothetical protein